MIKPTYSQIAANFRLWGEYIDPIGIDSLDDFNRMSDDEKLSAIEACFGTEDENESK